MAAHLLRNIPALLYFTDSSSGNPACFQSENYTFRTVRCPLLPAIVADRRFVVQLAQSTLTVLFGLYCFFVALLWRYVMFVFLPILLRFKLSGIRNNCCRMMYERGNSLALTRFTVTRYIGTHSVHWHSAGRRERIRASPARENLLKVFTLNRKD